MPIIYLKNPRSGSHFRHLGTGGPWPGKRSPHQRKDQARRGIRSVGWASCNKAFSINQPRFVKPTFQPGGLGTHIVFAIRAIFRLYEERPGERYRAGLKQPCR